MRVWKRLTIGVLCGCFLVASSSLAFGDVVLKATLRPGPGPVVTPSGKKVNYIPSRPNHAPDRFPVNRNPGRFNPNRRPRPDSFNPNWRPGGPGSFNPGRHHSTLPRPYRCASLCGGVGWYYNGLVAVDAGKKDGDNLEAQEKDVSFSANGGAFEFFDDPRFPPSSGSQLK
jgi:hypothetical protein